MKVLITGAAGFVGNHFIEFLCSRHAGVEIFAMVRPHGTPPPAVPGRIAVIEADVEDAASVEAMLEMVQPDRIVHLAARSSVHESWIDPSATLRTNVHGLLHLLEAVRKRALSPRVLVVGSAEEYGAVLPGELPVSEDAPLRPSSPYAVSKVAQGYLALQYTLSHRMGIVRTRTFHHTGPGRGESFAESSFARQIVEIQLGRRRPILEVGNLEAVRDFADVRDVVRAYWALLDRGESGEVYNVCSGQPVRMRDLLHRLIEIADVDLQVRLDPNLLRPADVPAMVGDPAKIQRVTDWRPRLSLDQSLTDLLAYWRHTLDTVSGVGRRPH